MTNKNEFDLTKQKLSNKAQAECPSELYRVIGEMKNGFDMQPLDDVAQEPKQEKFDEQDSSQKRKKKEKLPLFIKEKTEDASMNSSEDGIESIDNRQNRKNKTKKFFKILRICLIVAVISVGIATAGYFIFNYDVLGSRIDIAYSKDGKVYLAGNGKNKIKLDDAQKVKISSDGETVVYSQNTISKTGTYDLRTINMNKKSSAQASGTYIDNGVDEAWHITDDGLYVFYSKTDNTLKSYYMYNTSNKKAYMVTTNPDDIWFSERGDVVYYVRTSADTMSLQRYCFGSASSENIMSGISGAECSVSENSIEVIFTVKQSDDIAYLYSVSQNDAPKLISDNVSEVYSDDYKQGGNLYYIVNTGSIIDWKSFVNDSYFYSDLKAEAPDKKDYTSRKGVISKKTVFDSVGYNKAVEKYNSKIIRDKIRSALGKIDMKFNFTAKSDCYVYDGKNSIILESGISKNDIVDYAEDGSPRIICKKTSLDINKSVTMDELYSIYTQNGSKGINSYIKKLIGEDFVLTEAYRYVSYDGENTKESYIQDYKISNTKFCFACEDVIFAFCIEDSTHYTLKCNLITDDGLSTCQTISKGVSGFSKYDGYLYYTLNEDEKGYSTLMRTDGKSETVKIADNVFDYSVLSNGNAVYFVDAGAEENMKDFNIGLFAGKKNKILAKNVLFDGFKISGNSFSFIKKNDASSQTSDSAGELIMFIANKNNSVDTGVDNVYYIREDTD